MPLKKRPLRVVLAEPDKQELPELANAITAEKGIELIEIKDSPENIWRRVITHSPDITVFYAPSFGEAELRCINYILRGVYSRIIIITDEASKSKVPSDKKLEIYTPARKDSVFANEILARIKAIGPIKRGGINSEPEEKAVTIELEAPPQKHIIAIGASTGGTEALASLFHMLPENMPGIVVVQHMPPVFTKMYADRLNKELPFTVTEAQDNVQIKPGTIHIAPGDRHLLIKRNGPFFHTVLGNTEKVSGHCPSVDVLFESVANEAGKQATGIILTGMGADGALGLLRMRNRGAYTIGQDEASSVVYGMPRKAYEYGAVIKQASLTDIPRILLTHLSREAGIK